MAYLQSHIKKFPLILLYPFVYYISIIKTLYFNLHYFPIKVAIKIPVILYHGVKLKELKGTVELNCARVKPGLVRLGRSVYGFQTRNHLTIWEQRGGKVVFGENISLGRGTFISIGYNGYLSIGDNVRFGGNSKIICKKSITVGERTMVAWDAQIIDTDFHATLNTIFKTRNSSESSINIGSHNWVGFGCTLLKGSITPDHCILGANTSIKSDYSKAGQNILLAYEQNAKVTVKYITFEEHSEVDSIDEFPESEPEFKIVDQQTDLIKKSG